MDYLLIIWIICVIWIMCKEIPQTPNIAYTYITYNSLHITSHYTQHYPRMMKHVVIIFLSIDFLVQWNWLFLGFFHQNSGALDCSCHGGENCRNEVRGILRCNDSTWNRQMPCIPWIRLWIWKRWLPTQAWKLAGIPSANVSFWFLFHSGNMMSSTKSQYVNMLPKHVNFSCLNFEWKCDITEYSEFFG